MAKELEEQTENEYEKMTLERAQTIILSDIKQAKKAKKDIDIKINAWIDEYNGEPYGNEVEGFSKIVVKDIKKAVEWFIPNAVEPFVKSPRIVELDGITAEDVQRAKMHERLLNYQFVRKFDRYSFIHNLFKVSATEGTVNIRCGWEFAEEERVQTFSNQPVQAMHIAMSQGFEVRNVTQNNDRTVTFDAAKMFTTVNKPTADIIKNEDFYPDPSATCMDDCTFAAYDYTSTFGELKESGKYDEEDLEELDLKLKEDDSTLGSNRRQRLKDRGTDDDYESEHRLNKKVTVTEYFGLLDFNGDGVAEPIMATLINDKLLEIVDNPYPDKSLPFVSIAFSKVPFSFWGDALAEFLSDNQKIRTSIMRGLIDNIAQSNNGKKFIKKGAMDTTNKRKYLEGVGGIVEVNGNKEDVWDGNYNQLEPSIFNLFEIVNRESESLSGINRTMQGTDNRGLNDSATGAAIQQDMGQKRMMDIIRRHSDGLQKIFRKWISYNKEFLSDEEVMRINGEFIPFARDDISGEFDINITVGTDGVAEAKVNQMTMLMQQVGGLSDVATIPPQFFNMMLAKIADEWGYPDIAQQLETAQPSPPSQEQIEAQQLELEKMRQEIAELKSKAQLNEAKAIEAGSNANQKNVETKKSALGIVDKGEVNG